MRVGINVCERFTRCAYFTIFVEKKTVKLYHFRSHSFDMANLCRDDETKEISSFSINY